MRHLGARNMDQPIILPYKFPYILSGDRVFSLQAIDLNGGRDRTRTCDLLRVKQAL
jgi:hypothetical protein